MDAMTWLTLVLAMVGVASAVFAYVQAKAATDDRKDAEKARTESRVASDNAVRLVEEANLTATRQASALEESNRLLEMAAPTARADRARKLVQKRAVAIVSVVDRQQMDLADDVVPDLRELTSAFANLEMAVPAGDRDGLRKLGFESTTKLVDVRNAYRRQHATIKDVAGHYWSIRTIAVMAHDGRAIDEIVRVYRMLNDPAAIAPPPQDDGPAPAIDR